MVADHGSGEDSRFEEMLKYDTILDIRWCGPDSGNGGYVHPSAKCTALPT
jgi:hypothetical protein